MECRLPGGHRGRRDADLQYPAVGSYLNRLAEFAWSFRLKAGMIVDTFVATANRLILNSG
jgi:hypothetical protein